ncbi:MAG: tetratricopeptide repeat protein [Spirochaetales bacterium]|nr:tetratricopeptide repeat protein [Spirochaetales bacterium]
MFFSAFLLHAQSSPVELYENGRHELRSGDYYSSIDLFKQALMINPAYVDARKGMAEAYFLLQEYGEALNHAQAALRGAGGRVDIMTLMGRIYLGLNDLPAADARFQQALSIEPNNTEAAYGRAEIAVFRGNYSEGTDLFERSLAVNPDSRRALLSLSLLHEDAGDGDKSRYYLNRALDQYPQDSQVLDFAIRYFDRTEDWVHAEETAMKWKALDPDNDSIPVLLGTIYNKMGRNDEAVEAFSQAVRSRQEDPLVWYLLGRSYVDLGRNTEALLSFKTVNIIDPGNEMARIAAEDLLLREYPIGHEERVRAGRYHYDQARNLQRSYQYEKAMDEYRIARILSPLDLDIWWDYAEIQSLLGYKNRYREEMTALKQQGYDNERFLRVMELLEASVDDSFVTNWRAPMTRSHTPVTLSLYFDRKKSDLIHSGMEEALTSSLASQIARDPHYDIISQQTIADEAEAYRSGYGSGSDFYIVVSVVETQRTIGLNCSVRLSRTGSEMFSFNSLRSGNRRVSDVLVMAGKQILDLLPLKGFLLGIDKDRVLVNLGSFDGLEEEASLVLLRKDSGRWISQAPWLEFSTEDLLGTIDLTDFQESYSLGTVTRNSPFDLINAGDEVYLLTEEMELPDPDFTRVNEELKSQLLRLF